MTEILIPNPLDERKEEVEQRSAAATALKDAAENFVIDGPPAYELAIDETRSLRQFMKSVREWFAPMADAANATHKAITGRRAEILRPAEEAIGIYEKKIGAYRAEEQRKARELAEQERQRLAAEAAAVREAEALAAADRGDEAKFDALTQMETAPVPAPPVARTVMEQRAPKAKGMVEKKKWRARWLSDHPGEIVECAHALLNAIISPNHPHVTTNLIEPNWEALEKLAEATAGRGAVPGIEFYEEVKTTIRSR